MKQRSWIAPDGFDLLARAPSVAAARAPSVGRGYRAGASRVLRVVDDWQDHHVLSSRKAGAPDCVRPLSPT